MTDQQDIVNQAPMQPLVEELHPVPDIEQALLRLARRPHCVFFDSARRHARLGRYSFLAADPQKMLRLPVRTPGLFHQLSSWFAGMRSATIPELPPFQGGIAGLFSYDVCQSLERIPPARFDEFALPALAIGLYDVVLAYDHVQDRAWIISHGWPEPDPTRRRQLAARRLEQFRQWLVGPSIDPDQLSVVRQEHHRLAIAQLAPQFAVSESAGLTSNFSRDGYLSAVERAIEYIYAGDIFQVNLSQRLLYPARDHALALYRRLRRRNPAPFAGYFDLGDCQIASASPERLLQVRGREVETRPIKGTRSRTQQPEADLFAGDDLLLSEKDRAENVMIVDLLRNDLAKVCEPESVVVSELCRLEVYEFVQHLVSSVRGLLRSDQSPLDLLQAAFPGGSITGCPKVRAMEIIAELEPTARGAYCGSLGYVGFDGTMDCNLLIRTVTAAQGWWQAPVGGGIVAQSDPEREYEETWHKATGLIRALV